MRFRLWISAGFAGFLLSAGCATVGNEKSVTGVYEEIKADSARAEDRKKSVDAVWRETATMGDASPYYPVVLPPEVLRAWVPDHINGRGKMIAGHWIYVMVRDARFALEEDGFVAMTAPGAVVPHGPVEGGGAGGQERRSEPLPGPPTGGTSAKK